MHLTLCERVTLVCSELGGEQAMPAKSLALLAFLTLEPGVHSREELSSLLWSESAEDKARASLRQTLKHLKDVLGNRLQLDRSAVRLATPLDCDIMQFHARAACGDVCALEINVPRLLLGLNLRDAPAFDEWAERQRQTSVRLFRQTLSAAARTALAQRDWPQALALSARWQALDPLSDDATHVLVDVLHRMGDRDNALATFRTFRDAREREIGQPPGLALRELAARIEHAPSTRLPTPARAMAVMPNRPLPSFDGPLMGREPAWAALLDAWNTVTAGTSAVVLLEGDAGIGKTRLVADFAQFVVSQVATVLRGRAFEVGVDVPYGAILEILRGAVDAPGAAGTDGTWLVEVARVIPELRRNFPSLPATAGSPAASSSVLFEAIAQLLLAVAEETPLLILLDDVSWCDADSGQLLHYLMQRLASAPMLWCFTNTPGSADRDAPAARLTRALRSLPNVVRIALEPLSRDEVWRLIRTLGRVSHPDGAVRLASRMHEVSAGNPLYVIELLKSLFERAWLSVDASTQEWISTDSIAGELLASEVLPDVRAAVAERIAALPDEQHALLLTVATAGGPCHTSLLSYVHGVSRLRAAHVCDFLVERRLVSESDGHYLCANRIIGHVVLDAMGTSRRREVHRMIALALTDAAVSVRREPDAGAIARHAQAGGEPALAYSHALLASDACVAQAAWMDALGWLEIADECASTPSERRAVQEATTSVLALAGLATPPMRTATLRATSIVQAEDMDLRGAHVARHG